MPGDDHRRGLAAARPSTQVRRPLRLALTAADAFREMIRELLVRNSDNTSSLLGAEKVDLPQIDTRGPWLQVSSRSIRELRTRQPRMETKPAGCLRPPFARYANGRRANGGRSPRRVASLVSITGSGDLMKGTRCHRWRSQPTMHPTRSNCITPRERRLSRYVNRQNPSFRTNAPSKPMHW